MSLAIEIKNLYKSYKKSGWFSNKRTFPILKAINFTLEKGKVVGLVGESGCGKSTLCKVLLGIEPYDNGSVRVNDKEISKISKRDFQSLRRSLQVVYQDPYASLDPRMNVYQILKEPLDIHGIKKSKQELETFLTDILNIVGLDNSYLTRFPHEFSGGQRQRICIARALILEPSILIADEPVSALDVSVQAQILNLLKQIKIKKNLSMLFVTHDFTVARFLCDEIVVMYRGRIVEKGSTDSVFSNPQHPYTRKLLAAVPTIGKTDTPPADNLFFRERKKWGCSYAYRCKYATNRCAMERYKLNKVSESHYCACSLLPFK